MNPWLELEDGVHLFRDSHNVCAVRGNGGAWMIINAGTGPATDHLDDLAEIRDLTVLPTHHFRDYTAATSGRIARSKPASSTTSPGITSRRSSPSPSAAG
jgi:hypothetical protein